MHRPREKVAVLTQHVGHHEGRQLGIGVGVEQAVVRQRVEGVARLMIREVKQRRVNVVWRRDGGNLVVFIPCASSTTTTIASSTLTGVALKKDKTIWK